MVNKYQANNKRQKPSRKWVPKTPRLGQIMGEARHQAELNHDRIQKSKVGISLKKPSKAVTPRQISSKRSAEICRAKFVIYEELLEQANSHEMSTLDSLRFTIEKMKESLGDLKLEIAQRELKQKQKQRTDHNETRMKGLMEKESMMQHVETSLDKMNFPSSPITISISSSNSSIDTDDSEEVTTDRMSCEDALTENDCFPDIQLFNQYPIPPSAPEVQSVVPSNSSSCETMFYPELVEDSPVSEMAHAPLIPHFELSQEVMVHPFM